MITATRARGNSAVARRFAGAKWLGEKTNSGHVFVTKRTRQTSRAGDLRTSDHSVGHTSARVAPITLRKHRARHVGLSVVHARDGARDFRTSSESIRHARARVAPVGRRKRVSLGVGLSVVLARRNAPDFRTPHRAIGPTSARVASIGRGKRVTLRVGLSVVLARRDATNRRARHAGFRAGARIASVLRRNRVADVVYGAVHDALIEAGATAAAAVHDDAPHRRASRDHQRYERVRNVFHDVLHQV